MTPSVDSYLVSQTSSVVLIKTIWVDSLPRLLGDSFLMEIQHHPKRINITEEDFKLIKDQQSSISK